MLWSSVPWSARILIAVAVILAIPYVGEVVAIVFLFMISPLGLVLNPVAVPIIGRALMYYQHPHAAVYAGLIGLIALSLAAYFSLRLRLQWNNPQQKPFYVNALILTLGLPPLIAFSLFRVRHLGM